jgi:hypothetical protein
MKRKAILVIAIMMIMPGANAAGIRSANGQSQSAWNATPEYQNFQCPAGTARGEGVDMNFTTDRSDDYYFVECTTITTPAPAIAPTITETSTVQAVTPTVTTITDTRTATVVTNNVSSTTTTVSSSFDWDIFMVNFSKWFNAWFSNWFNNFFLKWLGM